MKYLNGVLTVIAFCLVLITASLLHIFPEAKAGGFENYQTRPTRVNIVQVNGKDFPGDPSYDNNGNEVQPPIRVEMANARR